MQRSAAYRSHRSVQNWTRRPTGRLLPTALPRGIIERLYWRSRPCAQYHGLRAVRDISADVQNRLPNSDGRRSKQHLVGAPLVRLKNTCTCRPRWRNLKVVGGHSSYVGSQQRDLKRAPVDQSDVLRFRNKCISQYLRWQSQLSWRNNKLGRHDRW